MELDGAIDGMRGHCGQANITNHSDGSKNFFHCTLLKKIVKHATAQATHSIAPWRHSLAKEAKLLCLALSDMNRNNNENVYYSVVALVNAIAVPYHGIFMRTSFVIRYK
jgi:capsule polysaccharide modification protein KpsS